MAQHLIHDWEVRANALEACGRKGIRLKCQGCGESSIVPFRCTCRTCPHAQRAAAAKITDRVLQRVRVHDLLMESAPWDGRGRKRQKGWRLLTLTLPVSRSREANWQHKIMRQRLRRIRKAWMPFWRSTPWGQQRSYQLEDGRRVRRSRRDTSAVLAGEFSPDKAMPHFHVMIYGEYVPQALLGELWREALGIPLPTFVTGRDPAGNMAPGEDMPPELWPEVKKVLAEISRVVVDIRKIDDPADGVKEVVKYVAKGVGDEPLPARHAAYIELALRNVHRVSIVGALRKVKITEEDTAHEELRPEDVHDQETLCCEGCGLIGEWKWEGGVDAGLVRLNGGFGAFGLKRWQIELYFIRARRERSGSGPPGRGGPLPEGFVPVTLPGDP